MPRSGKNYFQLGYNGKETFLEVLSNPNFLPPKSYKLKTFIIAENAPKSKSLTINNEYDFKFYIPRAYEVAIIDSAKDWTYFKRDKGTFNLKFKPNKLGIIKIAVRHETSGKNFNTVLAYEVNRNRGSI